MATCTLEYVFGLGEYFSRWGFAQGGLSFIGDLFRDEAKELINMELSAAGVPYSVRERGRNNNPCGLYLAGEDGSFITDILFDKKTGLAEFESAAERDRHKTHASAILTALTKANRAFSQSKKKHP